MPEVQKNKKTEIIKTQKPKKKHKKTQKSENQKP